MQNHATGQEADVEQLLKLHRDWYFSNYNINIPLMRTVFPAGKEDFLMFNLNDHPYFGVDDLDALWSFYARTDGGGCARTTSCASTSPATWATSCPRASTRPG